MPLIVTMTRSLSFFFFLFIGRAVFAIKKLPVLADARVVTCVSVAAAAITLGSGLRLYERERDANLKQLTGENKSAARVKRAPSKCITWSLDGSRSDCLSLSLWQGNIEAHLFRFHQMRTVISFFSVFAFFSLLSCCLCVCWALPSLCAIQITMRRKKPIAARKSGAKSLIETTFIVLVLLLLSPNRICRGGTIVSLSFYFCFALSRILCLFSGVCWLLVVGMFCPLSLSVSFYSSTRRKQLFARYPKDSTLLLSDSPQVTSFVRQLNCDSSSIAQLLHSLISIYIYTSLDKYTRASELGPTRPRRAGRTSERCKNSKISKLYSLLLLSLHFYVSLSSCNCAEQSTWGWFENVFTLDRMFPSHHYDRIILSPPPPMQINLHGQMNSLWRLFCEKKSLHFKVIFAFLSLHSTKRFSCTQLDRHGYKCNERRMNECEMRSLASIQRQLFSYKQ